MAALSPTGAAHQRTGKLPNPRLTVYPPLVCFQSRWQGQPNGHGYRTISRAQGVLKAQAVGIPDTAFAIAGAALRGVHGVAGDAGGARGPCSGP